MKLKIHWLRGLAKLLISQCPLGVKLVHLLKGPVLPVHPRSLRQPILIRQLNRLNMLNLHWCPCNILQQPNLHRYPRLLRLSLCPCGLLQQQSLLRYPRLQPASATHPSRISQAGHTSPAAKQAVETVKQPAETVQQHAETVQQLSQTAKHPAEAVQQPAEAAVSSLTAGTSTRKDDAVKKTSVPSKLLASLTSGPPASVDLVRLNHKQAIKMARGPDKSPDIPLKMSADDYLEAQKQTPSLILGAADYLQIQKSKSFNSFEFEPRSISRTLTPPCSSSAPFGVPG